jgi:uncharacterized protein YndB with AHSA1/START domain
MTIKTKPAKSAKPVKVPVGTEFIITREYAAPREMVWRACTEAKQLAQWWGPGGFSAPVCQWDAKPGNKIHVVMRAPNGTDYPMGGKFLEVVPPKKLVTTTGALDDQGNLMFEFHHVLTLEESPGGKTRLTMRSRLINVFTPDAARYVGGFEAGMTQSLERLAGLVETQPLVVERTFDAPVEMVWAALTTPEQMGRWYFDVENFKPQAGCEFRFVVEHGGNTYDHRCQVTEVIPQTKIAYTWRYHGHPGDSLVTFELSSSGKKTKLKLTHTGLGNFPDKPQFARKNFERGWNMLIGDSLPDYVENLDREIYVSREFTAPRELVWKAMTNPKHVVNWWGPRGFTTTIEQMDFRVGGVWKQVMHGPDGVNFPGKSIFKEIVKPEKIVYSHAGGKQDGPGASFISTWTFEATGRNKTKVNIRHVFGSVERRDFVVKQYNAVEGAKQTLERFGEYLAKM